jgi:outer membrane protein TolC
VRSVRGPSTILLLGLLEARPAAAQQPLTLAEAVKGALARNERAAIAAEELEAAEARLRQARALFLPDLTFTGKWRHQPIIERPDTNGVLTTFRDRDALTGTLEAKLTVFDARLLPLYGVASLQRQAQRLDTAEVKRRLAFQAADAYLVTLGAEQALAASERRVELARRTLDDAGARRRAALVGSNDVTKAELELATAEHEAERGRAEATSARLTLGNLCGAPVDGALVPPADLLEAQAVEPPQQLVERALRLRSDLVAARLRVDVADRLALEPLLRAVPSLALVGQYALNSSPGFGRERDWYVGADLVWTLYDGGARYGARDEQLALRNVAALSARAADRSADLDVRLAVVAVTAAQAASTKAEAAAAAARKNTDEVSALYRQGLATALDVADASVRAYSAELSWVGDRYAQARSVLQLRAALGLDPAGREAAP